MLKEILEKIQIYNTIIIHRHVRPDPDALGSQGGLGCLIRDNFPEKKVYLAGEEAPSLDFINTMDEIDDKLYEGALVIVCDTANTARISDERFSKGDFLIKIDHHPNEEPYGDLIWVNTSASSVSEMIVGFYEENSWLTLSKEAAKLLYTGIIGDTGRFLFNNTTEETFKKTSFLLKAPFDRQEIHNKLYETSLPLMRLNGYVLEHFEIDEDGAGVMKLPLEVTRSYNVEPGEASLLVNAFSGAAGIKAWVFFIEEEHQIRVRIRSKGPAINDIAAEFNGGGHPMASGATVYSWEESCDLLTALKQRCSDFTF